MRKFIALGAAAFSALALTLAPASPAKAAPVDLGIVSGLCSSLPGSVTNILNALTGATGAVATANADSVTKQADLATSTTALVSAVVAHIVNVNSGNDGGSTAGAVGTAVTDYAAKTVAANAAFTKSVDAQRTANSLANSQAFAGGIASSLCV
jgi:hypothetical protein